MYPYASVERSHDVHIQHVQAYEIPQVQRVDHSATLTLGNSFYEPASENGNTHTTESSIGAGNTRVT